MDHPGLLTKRPEGAAWAWPTDELGKPREVPNMDPLFQYCETLAECSRENRNSDTTPAVNRRLRAWAGGTLKDERSRVNRVIRHREDAGEVFDPYSGWATKTTRYR